MSSNISIYHEKMARHVRRFLPLCLLCLSVVAHGQLTSKYTVQRPVVVVCDWEFPPYEFSSDKGTPDGFNVDLLKMLLDELDVPYRFVMKESFQASKVFEQKKADLIVDMTEHFLSAPYYASRCIPNYYKLAVVASSESVPVNAPYLLNRGFPVGVKTYDYPTRDILKQIAPSIAVDFCSANEGVVKASRNKNVYFVWGEEPIKWFVKEMNLTNVVVSDAGLPVRPMRIVGHDKLLVDEIDDRYARMEQSGRLDRLHDKWFNPELQHDDESPLLVYVSMVILLLVICLFLLNRLAKKRANVAEHRNKDLQSIMLQALNMRHYAIIDYDVSTQHFSNLHGNMLPEEGANRVEMLEHFTPDERDMVKRRFADLLSGKVSGADLNLTWKPFEADSQAGGNEHDGFQYLSGHAIAVSDKQKRIHHVVCTVRYVTDEVKQERINSELASRYNKIFDTSLLAMSFYDKDGYLIDLNQQMRILCGLSEVNDQYFRKAGLFDNPYFHDDYDPEQSEDFYVCQHMSYPELGLDRYVEVRIRRVDNEKGEIDYFTVTAHDVTDERAIYLEQRQHDMDLKKINQQINVYEKQLYYLLEHSETWSWQSDVRQRVIEFWQSTEVSREKVSFDSFAESIVAENYADFMEALGNLRGADRELNVVIKFSSSPINSNTQWLAISGIPLHDDAGAIIGHFGIARDVTRLMETQEKLRKETKRADDSGKLKSVFLANMTHEIRTPLNAIVGFSDLLQVVEEPADRREFIRIIRNNCDMLLRLIDDIIEASNMNQGPIAIEAQDVDFALAFNDICQTLSQRVQEPNVQFIVDNPYESFVTCIDKGRMQQVITNFTTNAVKYTHEGHIKVGFAYISFRELKARTGSQLGEQDMPFSGIYMYCEDTGAGIPKEKQTAVFERFVKLNDYVQGTGLGLSICKSIADRCGGRIGVVSEGEGHGSTFWIWIPCPHKQ